MKILEVARPDNLDDLITSIWELGTLGVAEEGGLIKAYFTEETDLSSLLSEYANKNPQVLQADLAAQSFTPPRHNSPIFSDSRFVVVASNTNFSKTDDRIHLTIDADQAFGSGSHESTQLVIQALEDYVQPGAIVLDVGSGSGIVSAIAIHLNARMVIACDTHLVSMYLTRKHAPAAHTFAGSVDSIATGSMDVVIANISAKVIDQLSSHLKRITRPNGLLILSGFTSDRVPAQFTASIELEKNDWKCWICKLRRHNQDDLSDPTSPIQPFTDQWW